MPFDHACFISYRHGHGELIERIVHDLSEALNNELSVAIGKYSYVDYHRLKGGDFFNSALATALCRSACMVVVYTPTYFDQEYPYCALEYKAMEKLEAKRLNGLGLAADKLHGLIIPVVFRGLDILPKEIREERQYYDFANYSLVDRRLSRHPHYAPEIRKIAEYIADRYRAMSLLSSDPCHDCDEFTFPHRDDVVTWLGTLRSATVPFPMRGTQH